MPFRSLRDILPRTLEGLGIADRVIQERAILAWPAAARRVSPDLAARSRALGLQGTALVVRVADAGLAALVAARRGPLQEALNARLGEGAIQDVHTSLAP